MEKLSKALKNGFAKMVQYRYRVLICLLVFAILISALNYLSTDKSASVKMSLNYSEASSGLNPNNTRFNISELVSEEVMSAAIRSAGIAEDVKWKDLSECIEISPLDEGGSDEEGYICTVYQISYDASKLKKGVKAPTASVMIDIIANEYKSYFCKTYGDNQTVLDYEPLQAQNTEPYLRLKSLEVKLDQVHRYIDKRVQENKSYTDAETGKNFISLLKTVDNMKTYDIVSVEDFIIGNGVSKNTVNLVNLTAYKNKILALSYDKEMAFYDSDNDGIGMYDKTMSAIVMIPSVDASDTYYMSRTKTANDYMAASADSELQEATDYQKKIVENKYLISQMNGNKSPQEKEEAANTLIDNLEYKLNSVVDELQSLDISYIKYKTQNYLVFSGNTSSFIQRLKVPTTVASLVVLLVVIYVICFIIAASKSKKQKKAAGKIPAMQNNNGGSEE